MNQFFTYNNGRSIFNISHIVRIEVDEVPDRDSTITREITRYMVTTTNDITYYVSKEEYLRLLHAIGVSNGNS